jgi:iron complex outermembrane receptor protein
MADNNSHSGTATATAGCPFSLFLCALLASAICQAQESRLLEEVVVTAQKRAESLQDVAVSVSAFTSEQVDRFHFQTPADIASQVPNMSVYNVFGEAQQPFLGIRGIVLSNFNDSFESPIALYVDEVYKGSLIGQTTQIFDVERVEVLKGPQGTLYGRNTTGGLMHVITRKPTEEFELLLGAEFGDHNTVGASAAISGPISEGVRGRVAIDSRQHDGWAKGFLDGVDYSDSDSIAVRFILDIDISENSRLELSGHYSEVDAVSVGFGLRGHLDPVSGERCSLSRIEAGECVSPSLGDRSANDLGGLRPGVTPGSDLPAERGYPPRQDVELKGASAKLEQDFGNWMLTALAAYDEVEKLYEEDLDADGFLFNDGLSLDAREGKAEVRAAGDFEGGNWLVGLFYFDDRKDTGSFLIPEEIFRTRGIVSTESWAVFGQVEKALSEAISLTAGVRYTEEDKHLDFRRTGFIEDAGQRTFSSEDVTGKLALGWEIGESSLLYGSVSTGFKTGGFNTQFVFGDLAEIDPVDNENLLAYEVGYKSDLAGGRIRLNTAAFYYDYQDIQLNVFTTVPGAPFPSNFLRNAGDGAITGLDIELTFHPIEYTEVRMGLGLLDTELDSDQIVESAGVTTSIDGKELISSPGTTFNLVLLQTIPLQERGSLYIQGDYSWQDDRFFSIENVDTERQEAYGVLNLRLGWQSADRWRIEGYLENALDEAYSIASVDLDPTLGLVTWGKPRWWGIRLHYQY